MNMESLPSKSKIVTILLLSTLALSLVLTLGFRLISIISIQKENSESEASFRVGVPTVFVSAPFFIAEHNGYFAKRGLHVVPVEYSSGKAALDAMLADRQVDMAMVGQTPVVIQGFGHDNFVLVAGMASSYNDIKISARRDKGIKRAEDLSGKRIGVVRGSTGHYFLSLFLAQHGLALSDVQIVDMAGSDLSQALIDGRVDGISSVASDSFNAASKLHDKVIIFEGQGIFRNDLYLTAIKNWVAANPRPLRSFLSALEEAELFIEDHKEQSIDIISKKLNLDKLFLGKAWDDYSFRLFLDQATLLTLEQQSRWAQANNITNAATTPDYLNLIDFDGLEAVSPGAITIIR